MRSIGTYELKSNLSEVLDAVEHGQTVIVTRHGKPIARILPSDVAEREEVSQAVSSLLAFPRTRLPDGVTIRNLIEQRRR